MELTAIYRRFYTNPEEKSLITSSHETFSTLDHMLPYKASVNEHKKIKITPFIPSDYHGGEETTN